LGTLPRAPPTKQTVNGLEQRLTTRSRSYEKKTRPKNIQLRAVKEKINRLGCDWKPMAHTIFNGNEKGEEPELLASHGKE